MVGDLFLGENQNKSTGRDPVCPQNTRKGHRTTTGVLAEKTKDTAPRPVSLPPLNAHGTTLTVLV